jgi:Trk K+ transport system NAD-binding subunit
MISEEVGRPIRTVVDLVDKTNVAMMRRSNVDAILHTQDMNDSLIVQEYLHPGIHHAFDQLITNRKGSHFFIHETKLRDMRVGELQSAMLQQPDNFQLVGLVHEGAHYLNPDKQVMLRSGDQLILLAERKEDFERFESSLLSSRPDPT